jgi:protein O-GlcNAcase/histone acetyltransferase
MAQRRTLFARMHGMGMREYMYAPKDDLKHRAQWRQKYTDEECGKWIGTHG